MKNKITPLSEKIKEVEKLKTKSGLTKNQLKGIIKKLREENEYLGKREKEQELAHKCILWAVLDEAGIKEPTCPMCFKRFRNLKKYEEHLTGHKEVINKNEKHRT